MSTIDDLVMEAKKSYEAALELLNRGDHYDSAEKAWRAIEYLREAILVAAKIPHEKTNSYRSTIIFRSITRIEGEKNTGFI